MVKLLSSFVLILAIILFPPAALAFVSNNALPGDATYPIKRSLEDGIYAVVSLNPTTKAWFSAARSDRRFKEFSILIAQGKSALNTLNELVAQTEIATEEIKKVDNPVKKQELISQLSNSIEKYDQGLQKVSEKFESSASTVLAPTLIQVTPQASPIPPSPEEIKRREEALNKTHLPGPSLSESPAVTPSPTQAPTPQPAINPQEIDEAKKKLKEIKKKLEEERKDHQEKFEDRENNINFDKNTEEKKESGKEDFKTERKSGK